MTHAALVTLDELKEYMPVRSDMPDFDLRLADLAISATAMLAHWCNQEFEEDSYVQYFATRSNVRQGIDLFGNSETGTIDRTIEHRFFLKGGFVDENTLKVHYDPSRVWPDSSEKTTGWYYDADSNSIVAQFETAVSSRSVKVEYTAGLAVVVPKTGDPETDNPRFSNMSAAAPVDLKMACIHQTMYMYNKINSNAVGVSQQGRGSGSIQFRAEQVVLEAQQLAAPYRQSLMGRL